MILARSATFKWIGLALFAGPAFAACGSTGSTDASGVASITISAPRTTVNVGRTTQLTAIVRNSSGTPLSPASLLWNSDNQQVATVTQTGLVSGVSIGSATITASTSGVSGGVVITVVVPAPANLLSGS